MVLWNAQEVLLVRIALPAGDDREPLSFLGQEINYEKFQQAKGIIRRFRVACAKISMFLT